MFPLQAVLFTQQAGQRIEISDAYLRTEMQRGYFIDREQTGKSVGS